MNRYLIGWFAGWMIAALFGSTASAEMAGWRAGMARVEITPSRPLWMAGYASRKTPSEGKLHDLWAKALVLEDAEGRQAALVTLDLCGIDRDFSLRVRDAIRHEYGLDLNRIVLSTSHTHSGPVVGTNLIGMYPLDDEQREQIEAYTDILAMMIVAIVGEAFDDLSDAKLSWGNGKADFAVNRRENTQNAVPELRDQIALKGPVDHDVPVLKLSAPNGEVRGIVFGYACHCTTLDINEFSGDYAGFAMIELERLHPHAVAYYVAGCGADQNPLPRRSVELAKTYGKQLAEAVDRVLCGPPRPVLGTLSVAYQEIELDFGDIPDRASWETQAQSDQLAEANRAKAMLKQLDDFGAIGRTYPYPIQVWKLGDDLTWIFLGGEVVVDYSLRLKRNLGSSRTWVSAYCNDVMAYIPSLRVLHEGGYEGGGAMVYYGLPAPWAANVEDKIIAAIRQIVKH